MPNEMTPVRRYYSDLLYKPDSYVDLQISAERLLEQEGLSTSSQTYDALYGVVLPTPNEFNDDPEKGFNRFVTFPFDVIGSFVDATYLPSVLSRWYEDAAQHIRMVTDLSPTDTCYNVSSEASQGCGHGFTCPRRFMAARLILPVKEVDFDTVEYLIDPYRARAVALEKFDVAKRLAMIMVPDYSAYSDDYMGRFSERFGPEPIIG